MGDPGNRHAAVFKDVVCVVGMPTGGTSTAAGILHHLGVNMGASSPEDPVRKYQRYECPGMMRYCSKARRSGMDARIISSVAEWIEKRRKSEDGVIGFKHLWWQCSARCPFFPASTMGVLRIDRRPEVQREHDLHYALRRQPDITADQRRRICNRFRSGLNIISQKAGAYDRLCVIRYEDTVHDPGYAVWKVRDWLNGLFGDGPWNLESNRHAAAAFVDPGLNHEGKALDASRPVLDGAEAEGR